MHARPNSIGATLSVLNGVILREFQVRYFKTKAAFIIELLEPVVLVAVLVVIFTYLGRRAPVGESNIQYFVTALMVLYTCLRSESYVRSGARNTNLFQFNIVKPIDVFICRGIIESLTNIFIFALIIFVYFSINKNGLPFDYFDTIIPFFIAGVLGFSIGIINTIIIYHIPIYTFFWSIISRALFFTSGKFFLVEQMPPSAQEFLYYNPILHLVSWTRSGYYSEYNSTFLVPSFPIGMTLVLLFVALFLERTFRRKIVSGTRFLPV